MPEHADVVVVGGGSCGSVVAARLSDEPDRSVLLLEAGPGYTAPREAPADLLDATVLPVGPAGTWTEAYPATLSRGVHTTVVRGRVLGGSGAVNGAYFVRARPEDFRAWPASWSYRRMLPHFRAVETDTDFGGPLHGAAGPIPVTRVPEDRLHPVSAAFRAAAVAAGHIPVADLNAPGPDGVGRVPRNVRDGVRISPALAYLLPAARRPNLVVRPDVRVTRVVLAGGRAVGVDVVDGAGRVRRIGAGRVVLCAGAVRSPQLLLLSGIGPAADLAALGLAVHHDLPGVGRGAADHPEVAVPYRYRHEVPLRAPLLETVLHTRSLELRPYTVPFGAAIPGSGVADPVLGVVLTRPRSRGRVRLDRDDPQRVPAVDYRYLESRADRDALREGVRLAVGLLTAMDGVVEPRSIDPVLRGPGPDDAWLTAHLGTSLHLSGTCRMGDDETAVVDAECRVRGVDGLGVVDTSVFPDVPGRGPHATAVAVAHRVTALWDRPR